MIRTFLSGTSAHIASFFMAVAIWVAPRKSPSEEEEEYSDVRWEGELSDMELRAKRLYFSGSCYHVNNWFPQPAANRDYYVTALRNPENPEQTDIYMFTERELINAQNRADKNKEDIPEDIADFDRVIDRGED